MPESFGARLRQQRERQQIALTAIAEQTKIKVSLLEGLERDDVSNWPAGIFRRAFIRAYAHAIALEPDIVVREFVELHPDPPDGVAELPVVSPGEEVSLSAAPPTRLRCLVGSAISSLTRRWSGDAPGPSFSAAEEAASATEEPAAATEEPAAGFAPVNALTAPEPDLLAAASLCAELGRLDEPREAGPLLQGVARLLDAIGLIVWVWHPQAAELKPALAQGYSDKVLAQLPRVGRDTDNATAAAFRSANTYVVKSRDLASGAVVVPLLTPAGCVGVLAVELQHGREQRESVRALATIFAAQLGRVVGAARSVEETNRRLA